MKGEPVIPNIHRDSGLASASPQRASALLFKLQWEYLGRELFLTKSTKWHGAWTEITASAAALPR